jgi:hypothetical protein
MSEAHITHHRRSPSLRLHRHSNHRRFLPAISVLAFAHVREIVPGEADQALNTYGVVMSTYLIILIPFHPTRVP